MVLLAVSLKKQEVEMIHLIIHSSFCISLHNEHNWLDTFGIVLVSHHTNSDFSLNWSLISLYFPLFPVSSS